jgi:hypothetical protein
MLNKLNKNASRWFHYTNVLPYFDVYYAYPNFCGLVPSFILWRQSGIFWTDLCAFGLRLLYVLVFTFLGLSFFSLFWLCLLPKCLWSLEYPVCGGSSHVFEPNTVGLWLVISLLCVTAHVTYCVDWLSCVVFRRLDITKHTTLSSEIDLQLLLHFFWQYFIVSLTCKVSSTFLLETTCFSGMYIHLFLLLRLYCCFAFLWFW